MQWEGGILKGHKDTLGGDGHVYYPAVMALWVYTYAQTYQVVHFQYVQSIIGQLSSIKLGGGRNLEGIK